MKKYLYICCLYLLTSFYTHAQEKNTPYKSIAHKSTYVTIFDQLQDKEQLHINFTSTGCFHSVKEIMTIEKENDVYYVVFKESRKMLTSIDIKAIQKFEKGLTRAHDYGCTTIDTYLITYDGRQQMISDGGCRWNGYYDLKKALGFDE